MSEQEYSVLPRGVSQEQFSEAIDKFRALLGEDNVLVEPGQLVSYNKIMMPVENAAHAPSAALTATTVEQVQGGEGVEHGDGEEGAGVFDGGQPAARALGQLGTQEAGSDAAQQHQGGNAEGEPAPERKEGPHDD